MLKRFTLFIMLGKRLTRNRQLHHGVDFTREKTFDEIIDELETRDPPVDIRIVISAIITKPTVTKRRKKQTAKTFVRVYDIGCDGSLDN